MARAQSSLEWDHNSFFSVPPDDHLSSLICYSVSSEIFWDLPQEICLLGRSSSFSSICLNISLAVNYLSGF